MSEIRWVTRAWNRDKRSMTLLDHQDLDRKGEACVQKYAGPGAYRGTRLRRFRVRLLYTSCMYILTYSSSYIFCLLLIISTVIIYTSLSFLSICFVHVWFLEHWVKDDNSTPNCIHNLNRNIIRAKLVPWT